jgi:hypothetical protein
VISRRPAAGVLLRRAPPFERTQLSDVFAMLKTDGGVVEASKKSMRLWLRMRGVAILAISDVVDLGDWRASVSFQQPNAEANAFCDFL